MKILPPDGSFAEAAAVFKDGGIIAYPTETCYGLCADPFNPKAVRRLFEIKGRAETNPVSIIVKDAVMLARVVDGVPPLAEGLMKRFWPGPLTIIFNAGRAVLPELTANTGRIGVRISNSLTVTRFVTALDSPITATSANPTGNPPATSAAEAIAYFNGKIDMLIDGGQLGAKMASTVVDCTGSRIRVIREGAISAEELLG